MNILFNKRFVFNKKFNKKAMEMSFLVSIILVLGLLGIAVFSDFGPKKLIDNTKKFFESFDFTLDENAVPEQVIDEERIDAGTLIKIHAVALDSMSGTTWIKKQSYGQGWNLEYDEEELYVKYQTKQISLYDIPKEMVILPNKPLESILVSDDLRGSIKIDGKTYIHIPQQHDFQWFADKNNDEVYQEGEEINIEEIKKIILADLYTQATEE